MTERNLAAATATVGVVTADLFRGLPSPAVWRCRPVLLEHRQVAVIRSRSVRASFGRRLTWDVSGPASEAPMREPKGSGAIRAARPARVRGNGEPLVDFTRQQERRDLLYASAQASEKAQNLARQRYQFGVADFLTVLDAERTLLEAQDRLADSETTATALVAVYKALGGGWEIDEERAYSKKP